MMPTLPSQIEAINGRVQVSPAPGRAHIGLIVERGESSVGALLTFEQAQELARVLFDRSRG